MKLRILCNNDDFIKYESPVLNLSYHRNYWKRGGSKVTWIILFRYDTLHAYTEDVLELGSYTAWTMSILNDFWNSLESIQHKCMKFGCCVIIILFLLQ